MIALMRVFSSWNPMLYWCSTGAALVIHWCWTGAWLVLHCNWTDAALVLDWCRTGAGLVLHWCWTGAGLGLVAAPSQFTCRTGNCLQVSEVREPRLYINDRDHCCFFTRNNSDDQCRCLCLSLVAGRLFGRAWLEELWRFDEISLQFYHGLFSRWTCETYVDCVKHSCCHPEWIGDSTLSVWRNVVLMSLLLPQMLIQSQIKLLNVSEEVQSTTNVFQQLTGCTSLLIHLTRVILLLSALFPVFQVPLHSKLCFHVVLCPSHCRVTYEPSPTRLGVFFFFFFTVTCSSEENFCSSSAVRKLGAPSARTHTKQNTWCVWKVNFKVYSSCISN